MNTYIRKEVRLLLPFWGLAMLLAIVPVWMLPRVNFVSGISDFVFWAFGFGLVLVGMAPFGQELNLGTFPSLLAQPLDRSRIWRTKLVLVSAAAILVLIALVLSVNMRLDSLLRAATRALAEGQLDYYWNSRIVDVATKE